MEALRFDCKRPFFITSGHYQDFSLTVEMTTGRPGLFARLPILHPTPKVLMTTITNIKQEEPDQST